MSSRVSSWLEWSIWKPVVLAKRKQAISRGHSLLCEQRSCKPSQVNLSQVEGRDAVISALRWYVAKRLIAVLLDKFHSLTVDTRLRLVRLFLKRWIAALADSVEQVTRRSGGRMLLPNSANMIIFTEERKLDFRAMCFVRCQISASSEGSAEILIDIRHGMPSPTCRNKYP